MAAGVLIDTSFLITLADKNRAHHEEARRYWRHFLENQIPIFLSTIVVSEFCMKQEIDPQILRCCVVLPFNWDDAQRAARLDWKRHRPAGIEQRDALKDDIKIIAQAAQAEAEFVITDDSESFFRFCRTFKDAGEVQFKAIKLEDGFDRSFFDPNGQRDFTDGLTGENDPQT
jgi:predicted nucleic acid-binding protein